MGEAQRKTYTPAFKAKVGLEAIRGVKTVNEIGQDHGVHPNAINLSLTGSACSSDGSPGVSRVSCCAGMSGPV